MMKNHNILFFFFFLNNNACSLLAPCSILCLWRLAITQLSSSQWTRTFFSLWQTFFFNLFFLDLYIIKPIKAAVCGYGRKYGSSDMFWWWAGTHINGGADFDTTPALSIDWAPSGSLLFYLLFLSLSLFTLFASSISGVLLHLQCGVISIAPPSCAGSDQVKWCLFLF